MRSCKNVRLQTLKTYVYKIVFVIFSVSVFHFCIFLMFLQYFFKDARANESKAVARPAVGIRLQIK